MSITYQVAGTGIVVPVTGGVNVYIGGVVGSVVTVKKSAEDDGAPTCFIELS